MLPSSALADIPAHPDDWYADFVWIERRKCLLFVHDEMLFTVFVADVRKPQLVAFGQFVTGAIVDALADEGLPADQLGPLDPTDVGVARLPALFLTRNGDKPLEPGTLGQSKWACFAGPL